MVTVQLETVDLMGVPFLNIDERGCVSLITERCIAGKGGWVVTPNLDILRQCIKDPNVRSIVDEADFCVADGMPLIWASQLQRTPLPERVCGSDLVTTLSSAAADRGLKVFLLGGAGNSAERTADLLTQRYPKLVVAGTHAPPFGFEGNEAGIASMRQAVLEAQPDFVFVALGFPKQEKLIQRLRADLPKAWWIGVGISFSYVSEDVKRAPDWMQDSGFEWLHRLFKEPRRLARRYLVDDLPFAIRLLAKAT